MSKFSEKKLQKAVIEQLKTVFDPEIPVNVYDLGLIYEVNINEDAHADIKMTLTTPGCPVAQTFPSIIEKAASETEGIESATVELVWDPPWTQERMSQAARVELGMFF